MEGMRTSLIQLFVSLEGKEPQGPWQSSEGSSDQDPTGSPRRSCPPRLQPPPPSGSGPPRLSPLFSSPGWGRADGLGPRAGPASFPGSCRPLGSSWPGESFVPAPGSAGIGFRGGDLILSRSWGCSHFPRLHLHPRSFLLSPGLPAPACPELWNPPPGVGRACPGFCPLPTPCSNPSCSALCPQILPFRPPQEAAFLRNRPHDPVPALLSFDLGECS